jgi:glycosyltransferase involved in cell wall biosynthesis
LSEPKKIQKDNFSLLYVGEFSKNKNISAIVKTIDRLREKGRDIQLVLIGQYGDNVKAIAKLVSKRNMYIKSYPKIIEKNKLMHFYRNADIFIMPSFHETFGLVYLEAMSQGLPVIYTKGQGFAGYYSDGEIGYAVNPKNLNEIIQIIELITDKYEEISKRCITEVNKFTWEAVASKYIHLYKSVIRVEN